MSRVTFKFKNGSTRVMHSLAADVLYRRGLGTYMTRDLVADRTAPALATSEEVDSAGNPWNAELHVASKLKNQDGTWRKKPGAHKAATE
jgi:hypothetical protein